MLLLVFQLGDDRFKAARLVDEKVARNELGPKTGRGFFDYAGDKRDTAATSCRSGAPPTWCRRERPIA